MSKKIEAIENLLNQWKLGAYEFYSPLLEEEIRLVANIKRCTSEIDSFDLVNYDPVHKKMERHRILNEGKEVTDKSRAEYHEINKEMQKVLKKREKFVNAYEEARREYSKFYQEKASSIIWSSITPLSKAIDREVASKKLKLLNQIEKKIGAIVDASNLYFGYDDGINGIIIGEKGKARVETIYAGGYNIQCLHFRVLVKPIK